MRVLILSIVFLAWWQSLVSAQNLSPQELATKIRKDVSQRDVGALMDSLSSVDGENFNLVMLRGMTGSVHETHVTFQSVLNDERVSKLYEKLKSLDKREASRIVSESFESALSNAKKSHMNDGIGFDPATGYGLHAKLWLSFEFGELKSFNKHMRAWNEYSLQSSLNSGSAEIEFPGPELLMYLNLVYLEEKRSDPEGSSVVGLIEEMGVDVPFETTIGEYSISAINDPDDGSEPESLRQISLFRSWNGLGRLDKLERAKLMRKAGARIDPDLKPTLSDKLIEDLSDWIQEHGVSKVKAALPRKKLPMELHFLGPIPESKIGFMSRAWHERLPPNKKDFMYAVELIQQHVREVDRDDWDGCVGEVRSWLADLPEEGIEATEDRMYLQWPSGDLSNETPRIRLSMKGIKALQGVLEKEESDEGDSVKDGK